MDSDKILYRNSFLENCGNVRENVCIQKVVKRKGKYPSSNLFRSHSFLNFQSAVKFQKKCSTSV